MTGFIGDPPPQWIIRVTKGCDTSFTLIRNDDTGAPINWGGAVRLDIDIGADPPTSVAATVTASEAAFYLDAEVCDQVGPATAWRAIFSEPTGSTTVDTPIIVGMFQRNDGYLS